MQKVVSELIMKFIYAYTYLLAVLFYCVNDKGK